MDDRSEKSGEGKVREEERELTRDNDERRLGQGWGDKSEKREGNGGQG